ncbi:mariner Mos1 transposase [Ditylenchus destructor]|uniref:Mariner Mos1 transposase n=1 Tax=Ditylenchus destructor TaxID=166010 RepID=A0AAD4QZA0_9BILA|nr:mariner Mos1 transposase [Ditylenchus destructor]
MHRHKQQFPSDSEDDELKMEVKATPQLQTLKEKIAEKRSNLETIMYHHDNAKPHVEDRIKKFFAENNWEIIPQPSCSPDVALTDCVLNRSYKNFLRSNEKQYKNYTEVGKEIFQWINTRPQNFWSRAFEKLPNIWNSVIEANGEYISLNWAIKAPGMCLLLT